MIPAYNAENYIAHTLQSVLTQTYHNIEVIVVDDGSQDRTGQIVEAFATQDSRVLLLRQANRGVAAARNLAIEKSIGEYIAPIDADDLWFPEKIEKQVRLMEESDPSVGLVYTWWFILDDSGFPIVHSHPWTVEGDVLYAHLALNFIGNASVPLIRRTSLELVGGYDPSFRAQNAQGCEDWDLSLRIAEHYEMRVVKEYLTGYRRTAGSMSGNFDSMIQSHELMLEQLVTRQPEVPSHLLRWSRGLMYGYIIMIGLRTQDYSNAARWFFKALRSRNVSFVSPWIIEVISAKLPILVGRPVASLAWHMSKSHDYGHSSTYTY